MSSILWLSLVMFISPYKSGLSHLVLLLKAVVLLSKLCPLQAPLELSLLDSKFPGQFIQLLLIVVSHLDGGAEVLVQLLNSHLVVHAGGLNNLDGLEDIVGSFRSEGKLGDGVAEGVSGLLVLFLHQHDPPGQGGHISLHLFELLLCFLKGLSGLGQLVVGLIKADLKSLDFLAVVPDVAISLLCPGGSLLGGVLEALDGGIETISLGLEALHLLADGVHGCG